MSEQLRQDLSYGPWKGIWQGPNPPKNSFKDMCNLMISGDHIVTRPGVKNVALSFGTGGCVLIGAFRFAGTAGYPLQGTDVTNDVLSNTQHFVFLSISSSTIAGYVTSGFGNTKTTIVADHTDFATTDQHINHENGLIEMEDGGGNTIYCPCEILVNGQMRNSVYIPSGRHDGTTDCRPIVKELIGIDGGLSNTTYLTDLPRCKYVAKFQGRFFIGGGPQCPKTVLFSGANDAGVFPVNVWPASYNLDIPGGDDITGMVATSDALYVFKEHSIWAISGDGVGGSWAVTKISDTLGAIPGDTCVQTPDGIFFVDKTGICVLKNGSASNISRDALQETWKKANMTVGRWWSVYDESRGLVLFFGNVASASVSLYSNEIFVYDMKNGAFYRWGATLIKEIDEAAITGFGGLGMETIYYATYLPGYSVKGGSVVMDLNSTSGFPTIYRYLSVLSENRLYDNVTRLGGATREIIWFAESQDVFDSNNDKMLFRKIFVDSCKTGDWSMRVFPIIDDKKITQLAEQCGGFANLIDSANSDTHDLDRTCPVVAGDKVDVFRKSDGYKLGDSLTVASLSGLGASEIKFTTTLDCRYSDSQFFIVKEDTLPYMTRLMYDNAKEVFGNASCKWADTTVVNTTVWTLGSGISTIDTFGHPLLIGNKMRIRITNLGTTYSVVTKKTFASKASRAKIRGFGVLYRPLGTKRL